MNAIFSRRSIRKFQNKEIQKEAVRELLRAEELGLGTLWIANTCFAYRELTEYLETDKQLVGAVAVGYADEKPGERPRKGLEDVVEYRW